MNKLLLCLLLAMGSFTANSQKVYFIYLQSEQDQPFFVKMDEKVYSSSASGYLILSRLRDSTYTFTIGFPQQKWPEQKFAVSVRSKDHGYILKNFGEKGWGLFDLQTLAIQMAIADAKTGRVQTELKEVTPFTDILARAADDPSLREKPIFVAQVEEKKPDEKTVAIVPAAQPPVVKTESPEKEVTKDVVTSKPVEVVEKPAVKIGETIAGTKEETVSINKETNPPGKDEKKDIPTEPVTKPVEVIEQPAVKIGEMGVDPKEKDEPGKDNSKVIAEKEPAVIKPPVNPAAEKKDAAADNSGFTRSIVTRSVESTTAEGINITFIDQEDNGQKDTIVILIPETKRIVTETKEAPKEEKKFLDIVTDPVDSVRTEVVKKEELPPAVKPLPRNTCREFANESDFLKLRKKMVAETDDDDMVDEARKYFKTKCFSTTQIRNLGVLFLDDLGKYKFFDMAYLFVSDIENFSSLQSELKGEYYINRFKAMLK